MGNAPVIVLLRSYVASLVLAPIQTQIPRTAALASTPAATTRSASTEPAHALDQCKNAMESVWTLIPTPKTAVVAATLAAMETPVTRLTTVRQESANPAPT